MQTIPLAVKSRSCVYVTDTHIMLLTGLDIQAKQHDTAMPLIT